MRLTLALALLVACSGDDEQTEPPEQPGHHGHGHGHGHGGHHAPSVIEPTPAALARVVRVEGAASAVHRPGERLGATAVLSTGLDELVLDLREGARVEVMSNTTAQLGEEAPAQILLGAGQLHAIMPPMGSSPRPPLRIGTPACTIEIPAAADVWVLSLANGATWLAVLGGNAFVLTGEADDAGREIRAAVGADRSIVVSSSGSVPEPTDGPDDASLARAMASELSASASPMTLSSEIPDAVAKLDAALEAVEAEIERGSRLAQAHRAALSAMSPDAPERMQDIVQHGRALDGLRDRLRTRFERARAWVVFRGPGEDPSADRRQRTRAALGL